MAEGTDRATCNHQERVAVTPFEPLLLDIHQLARALNVGRTTIENWTHSRRIPSLKLGRVLRYDLKKVLAALEAYERKAI
jgi:excisionase family DNA binding protein